MYDFGFTDGPKLLDSEIPKLHINDAKYHEVAFSPYLVGWTWTFSYIAVTVCAGLFVQVSVIYHQSKKVILLVDKGHVKTLDNEKTTLPFSDIYIGGAPSHILKSRYGKHSPAHSLQQLQSVFQELHLCRDT